ncbi:uncharacterized protein EV154DRAFT_262411 [Mucor mucedo]|uniref:uncharacterized protein n=1 Tax=Mucor mucedo TaxID=29922 RepID=UPI00221EED04|nr:uncharacterized protein EV154DRAFT_262411 [Mucor mucedo]KAI7890080.1 hypothetical protein EV154DRAFT_262411 [Mucor mucedo]
MKHLSFRSAAATLSGKKKELVAKEEAKYHLAFENEQRARRDLDVLETKYETTKSKEQELSQQKSHFEEIKYQYDTLLEQIFTLDDPMFPLEPRLKAELANYKEQRLLANRDRGRFIEAEKALGTCLVDTKKVIRLLDTVVNYVPFEIFGGPIIDEEQIAYLDAAKRRVWEIQRLLNIARTVLPEIPYPQTLDVVTNNPLLQMQITLTYVDISWKAKTTQCFGMLATAYRNIQNSLTWVKQYLQYATTALGRLNEALDSTKVALYNERRRIIEAVLASSDGANLPSFTTTYHGSSEPPPPVYEAPADNNSDSHENQQNHLPNIPNNLTPAASISDFPLGNDSPVMPAAQHLSTSDSTVPPHPITPVFGNTNMSPSYVSTNVNNPFK